jgi:hypothetical protein
VGGYIKAKTPCPRCGWKYEGWHVCFDASKKIPGEGVVDPLKKKSGGKATVVYERTEEHRQAISETNKTRWAKIHEKNKERDSAIVAEYKEGTALWPLSKKYGIAYKTVIAVIRRYEEATGEQVMRSPGVNNRHREARGGFN